MWWFDADEVGGRDEGPGALPMVGPWMQVVTGTSGWLLGGGHPAPRRTVPEERLAPLLAPVPAPAPSPLPSPRGEPATLRQLGLPRELAHDLEVALRAMGATGDGRVIGFTFRDRDDTRHELVLEPGPTGPDRAA